MIYKSNQKSLRTPEKTKRVRKEIHQSLQCSAKRHSQSVKLSDRTVRIILLNDLQHFPYKI